MIRTTPAGSEAPPSAAAVAGLDDLVALAAVIAAGCERCAQRSVRRALQRGCARSSIARALEIVARLRAYDCLAQTVGPEVIARMGPPLQAAWQALDGGDRTAEGRPCCDERRGDGRTMG